VKREVNIAQSGDIDLLIVVFIWRILQSWTRIHQDFHML